MEAVVTKGLKWEISSFGLVAPLVQIFTIQSCIMHDDLSLQKCLISDIFISTPPQVDMKDWTVYLQSQGNCR